MQPSATAIDPKSLNAFVETLGTDVWRDRLAWFAAVSASHSRVGSNVLQRHCIEIIIERLRRQPLTRRPSVAELWIASYAADAVATTEKLSAAGRERWLAMLRTALQGDACLSAPFYLLRTAASQHARGYAVRFAGLEDDAPFDLLIQGDGGEAELVCDMMSAEEGHGIHRATWSALLDHITPDLQLWLRANPGRYLLKMTLPDGLRTENASTLIAILAGRVTAILQDRQRSADDKTAVLRFDPLTMAAARADDLGMMPRLRQEFGPEAQLAATTTPDGLFVIAARAGRENDVARAVRCRLDVTAPARLSGTRPGIVAMFIEDTDQTEWRLLRDNLLLEGEVRHFMTHPEAQNVVAVTCGSRLELFGLPDAEIEGELRYRNQAHPAAKNSFLAPAILPSHPLI